MVAERHFGVVERIVGIVLGRGEELGHRRLEAGSSNRFIGRIDASILRSAEFPTTERTPKPACLSAPTGFSDAEKGLIARTGVDANSEKGREFRGLRYVRFASSAKFAALDVSSDFFILRRLGISFLHATILSMQLGSLKVFCDVARHRSFSLAAAANDITQSAASQIVSQLEKHMETNSSTARRGLCS
ncbi:MAG: LysR family transcriptional regulator [Gemmataceae bacterium]